jgi:hypothetical protein
MAKLSAPGKMPPAVAILLKHHFWLLALLMPLVLLPLLLMAQGNLREQVTAMQGQIKGAIDGLRGVRRIPQHPNSSWTSEIDASTKKVKLETYVEWKKFWDSQKPLRTWPAKQLGADFVKAAESLKPGGSLPRPMLERYQDRVRGLVRELPGIMGAENAMTEVGDANAGGVAPMTRPPRPPAAGPGRPGTGAPGETIEVSPYFVSWNAQNQNTVYASFNWETPPTTTKVLLAQEELRVYGLLCELIARMNKSGTGPHNVAIAAVDELFVGYPAAEDNPGGASGGRITVVTQAATDPASGMAPPPDMAAPGMEGGAGGRPPHPRFTGAAAGRGGMAGSGGMPGDMAAMAEPVNPDEQLRNWIYVDFNGKPLSAAELAAAVDAQMVHLLPFVLRVVIDQRQIDALLTEMATASLPIDVRQVRINAAGGPPGAAAGGMMEPMMMAGGVPGGAGPGSRLYDVTLELRGSIGLATEPNEQAVGLEPGEAQPAAPEEPEAKPAPKATATNRRERWRLAS